MKRLIQTLMRLSVLFLFTTHVWADICYYRWVYCVECGPYGSCLQGGWNSVPYYAEGGTTATIGWLF